MQRLAAYALCLRDDHILLAHWASPDGTRDHWTLPGGGVDEQEDPYDAVVRELEEETGYTAEVSALLGVDSRTIVMNYSDPPGQLLHAVGLLYEATVTGGALRDEIGGSTDMARWIPLAEVPTLERATIIDVGLALLRERPRTGHVPPIPTGGLLH
ncbi:NUDIX hydrolase [Paractinoplanes atraurantiacus]|uniref:ADP-ribose pyrophosphatase YjhB, NUDIX family n=1 Tax=Paractinoplanes atraurantiacus TaxID=1036182 RepID=A0A285IEC7_9ACTN|nr:NUDIX hydrolase [Actinoplanes atraurantiacus]SNY45301.1 ADP-ribose pyrophosphatase YjhB, NUDIX family [Actinoplanes atraurantiacus]